MMAETDAVRLADLLLGRVLAEQRVRHSRWEDVMWGPSVDAPGLLAVRLDGVEVAWLDADRRLSVVDEDGNVLETGVTVAVSCPLCG